MDIFTCYPIYRFTKQKDLKYLSYYVRYIHIIIMRD